MEWVTNVSLVLALALSAFNLWDKLDAKKKALKEPTKALENRIAVLERTVNYEQGICCYRLEILLCKR